MRENLKTKNVLVHCHMGISRSATMVLAFLMEHFRMNLNEAYQHTVAIRDTI
jgi:protein-tyrosine phosphatase